MHCMWLSICLFIYLPYPSIYLKLTNIYSSVFLVCNGHVNNGDKSNQIELLIFPYFYYHFLFRTYVLFFEGYISINRISFYLSLNLCIYLSIYIYIYIYLFINSSINLSTYLSVCPSIYQSINLFIWYEYNDPNIIYI